ncbi:MAG: disulfide bond formation protein B [Fimbriimonadales bacterium]|nr:disulfide bond formation protein B [Fimbriimonadales bacterium]
MPVSRRAIWIALAAAAAGIALLSILLTHWLDLEPCHLCIFQRLVFMLLALLATLTAWLWRPDRPLYWAAALPFLALATLGAGVAAYQSWLQWQPAGALACSGRLGPIERLVEWLGEKAPLLFLASGACEDKQWVFLGLSLANWSFLAFGAAIALGVWTLRLTNPGRC